MMPALNFTAVEILPKLLSQEKTQTIRPAWMIMEGVRSLQGKEVDIPPRFNVGDKVRIYWNQRSKFHIFNKVTGEGKYVSGNASLKFVEEWMEENGWFSKKLGTVEITEVFKIEMRKRFISSVDNYDVSIDGNVLLDNIIENLAKRDGFSSAEEMFKWFNKKYDLSSPKEFWVYRWRWL